MNAAATLPAPTPMKSRSTSVSKPPSSANERVVAEVWVITIRATARALGSRRQTRWAENVGACSPGRPAGSPPRVTTPLAARSKAAEAASDSSTPSRAPGRRRFTRSQATMTAKTATATASAYRLVSPMFCTVPTSFCSALPDVLGKPSTAGSWPTMMVTAMPARKPVTTGTDRKSAIQPMRATPTPMITTPTSSASSAMSPA